MQPQAYAKLKEIIFRDKPDEISTILVDNAVSPRVDVEVRESVESVRSDVDCTNQSITDNERIIAGNSYKFQYENTTSFSFPGHFRKSDSLVENSYLNSDFSYRTKDSVFQSNSISTPSSGSATNSILKDSTNKETQSSGIRGTSSFSITAPIPRTVNVAFLTDEQLENQINSKFTSQHPHSASQSALYVSNPLSSLNNL